MIRNTKPDKPYPEFPLFAHASGQWAKKIKGKLKYFGPWNDPDAALARFEGYTRPDDHARRSRTTPANLASTAKPDKPRKPRKEFPLYPHAVGQWAKRVRGRVHYFGPWADPDAALARWNATKDDLLAGNPAKLDPNTFTVADLINEFLRSKGCMVDRGKLSPRTWRDYRAVCRRVLDAFGATTPVVSLRPADFRRLRQAFETTHGPVAVTSDVTRTRVLFNYGVENHLIDRPPAYGTEFDKPSRLELRKARQAKGKRMIPAEGIRRMIAAARPQLRAMILLGINCGLGNSDCERLRKEHIRGGWLDYPRPKTGIPRRCPLWPETRRAIREAIAANPKPKDPADRGLVFLTHHGRPWCAKSEWDNPIAKETVKLMKALKIHRKGLAFYALRHTFATIGYQYDKDATKAMMGHAHDGNDMSAVYDEGDIDPERLIRTVLHVRNWLRM